MIRFLVPRDPRLTTGPVAEPFRQCRVTRRPTRRFKLAPWFLISIIATVRIAGLSGQGLCEDCVIDMDVVATLLPDATTGAVHPVFPLTLSRDEKGRFFVAPMEDLRSVGIFGPDGTPVGKIVGMGRGSFSTVFETKYHDGELFVVDRGHRKIYILPVTSDRPPDSISLGYGPEGILALPKGRILTQRPLNSSGLFGMPFHIHTREQHLRSFGRSLDAIPPYAPYRTRRNIAPGGGDEFWASAVDSYRVERWSLEGEVLATFEHERSWFEPWDRFDENLSNGLAPTWFDSIRVDPEQGLVWCIFRVADGFGYGTSQGELRAATRIEQNGRYNTVVEVLRTSDGSLLASAIFDEAVAGYLNSGANLYEFRAPTDKGGSTIRVVRMTLHSPPNPHP